MRGICFALVIASVFVLACGGSDPVSLDVGATHPQTPTESPQSDGSEPKPTPTPIKVGDTGLIIRDLKLEIEPDAFWGFIEVVMFNELDTECKAAHSVDLLSEDGNVVSTLAMHYEYGIPPGEEVIHGVKFMGPGTDHAKVTWTSCTARSANP